MAKKKRKTKDEALPEQALTEQEVTSAPPAKAAPRLIRKTYLMTDELIRRVQMQAEAAGVGVNEMNRYLLTVALEQVEGGQHEIQVTTVTRRTLGV